MRENAAHSAAPTAGTCRSRSLSPGPMARRCWRGCSTAWRLEAGVFRREIHLDARLLDILACPVGKGPLRYERKEALLICRADRLAFPIRDDIPVMLEDEARVLAPDDRLLDR